MLKHTSVLAVALVCVLACSSQLTRSSAKSILEKNSVFTTPYGKVEYLTDGYAQFVAMGGENNPEFAKLVATADRSGLTLRTPYTLAVDEITGIADPPLGQAMKQVDFTWSSRGIPDVLKLVVRFSGTGQVLLRRYDDGWRVEQGPSRTPDLAPVLTMDQAALMTKFRSTEEARSTAIRIAAEKHAAEVRALVAQSHEPTKELFSSTNVCLIGNGVTGYKAAACGKRTVTDVGWRDERPANRSSYGYSPDPSKPATSNFEWFGDMDEMKAADGCYYAAGAGGGLFSIEYYPAGGGGVNSVCFLSRSDRDSFLEVAKTSKAAWLQKFGAAFDEYDRLRLGR